MSKRNVAATVVRTWAKENMDKIDAAGQVCLGEGARGRLHPNVITAFNRSNKNARYGQGTPNPASLITETVVMENAAGRKYPKKVTLTTAEVKALTGHTGRGRIPNAVKAQAAALKAQG